MIQDVFPDPNPDLFFYPGSTTLGRQVRQTCKRINNN